MEILGIGPLEALFVLILALLVVGPQDLGKAARTFGRFLNRLYRSEAWSAITQASRNLRTLPNRLAREAAPNCRPPRRSRGARRQARERPPLNRSRILRRTTPLRADPCARHCRHCGAPSRRPCA